MLSQQICSAKSLECKFENTFVSANLDSKRRIFFASEWETNVANF